MKKVWLVAWRAAEVSCNDPSDINHDGSNKERGKGDEDHYTELGCERVTDW